MENRFEIAVAPYDKWELLIGSLLLMIALFAVMPVIGGVSYPLSKDDVVALDKLVHFGMHFIFGFFRRARMVSWGINIGKELWDSVTPDEEAGICGFSGLDFLAGVIGFEFANQIRRWS